MKTVICFDKFPFPQVNQTDEKQCGPVERVLKGKDSRVAPPLNVCMPHKQGYGFLPKKGHHGETNSKLDLKKA